MRRSLSFIFVLIFMLVILILLLVGGNLSAITAPAPGVLTGLLSAWRGFIIFLGVALCFYTAIRAAGNRRPPVAGACPAPGNRPDIDESSLRTLLEDDPAFDAAALCARVREWAVVFEYAWLTGDLAPCKPFLTDNLYTVSERELFRLARFGEHPAGESLAADCVLERFARTDQAEQLYVWLTISQRVPDDAPVVRAYRWQLCRPPNRQSDWRAAKMLPLSG